MNALKNITHIIAVASGKGGVGKSTTAVNLALALAAEGANVGLLDADIYGPSQQLMLGVPAKSRPESHDQKTMEPIEAHGLKTMSMGYLVDEQGPVAWRGPMASQALEQMLGATRWGKLDYLIIDMPPGTGDIQLTLAQKVPLTGALIVTTPQDIALLDARKGIEMFRKVEVPVLGIVENMSVHICRQCGFEDHLFGHGGGQQIAQQYNTELLASLPLDIQIRTQADSGKPTVVAEPEGRIAGIYRQLAQRIASNLIDNQQQNTPVFPEIIAVEN